MHDRQICEVPTSKNLLQALGVPRLGEARAWLVLSCNSVHCGKSVARFQMHAARHIRIPCWCNSGRVCCPSPESRHLFCLLICLVLDSTVPGQAIKSFQTRLFFPIPPANGLVTFRSTIHLSWTLVRSSSQQHSGTHPSLASVNDKEDSVYLHHIAEHMPHLTLQH